MSGDWTEYETLNLRFGKDLELFRYAQLVNSRFAHFDKITGNFGRLDHMFHDSWSGQKMRMAKVAAQ